MASTDRSDLNPAVAELLDDAFVGPVDVETAARHLWAIHDAARGHAAGVDPEPAPAQPVPSLAGRRIPRAAIPVLALVMVLSSSGVAVAASQGSLPGDVLYPVKRGSERAQLIFARDPVTRAELQLSFARTRLDEITRIAETRPQHVESLVQEITVTLDEVDQAPPEVAVQVQPLSQSIRHEAEVQIAALPPEIGERLEVATTSVPIVGTPTATTAPTAGDGATATPTTTGTPTATGSEVAAADGTEAATDPTATEGTATPTPTASDGASPTPTTDGSEEPDPDATATPADPDETPTPATGTPTGSASPGTGGGTASPGTGGQGTASPSATPTPTPTSSEGGGPVVTARPQPVENPDDGESRSEGEDEDADGSPEPTPQPGEPLGRPGTLGG